MLVLGVLLLGASAAFAGLLISENLSGGPNYTVTMFDNTLGTVNTLGAFLTGIALTLAFCLALAMIATGSARQRRRNAEMRTRRRVVARDADMAGTDPAAAPPPTRRHRRTHLFGH